MNYASSGRSGRLARQSLYFYQRSRVGATKAIRAGNLIKHNPRMPYRQMAEELGINDSAVKKHLDKLKEAGVVERVGGTRGYWKVKE